MTRESSLDAAEAGPAADPTQVSRESDVIRQFKAFTFSQEVGSLLQYCRKVHHPGGASGVTIGAGYDMKLRTAEDVFNDLRRAGVPEPDARALSDGAGRLRSTSGGNNSPRPGFDAAAWVRQNQAVLPKISEESVRDLFVFSYKEKWDYVRGVINRASGNWAALSERSRALLVELGYRGYDLTAPGIRSAVSIGSEDALRRAISDFDSLQAHNEVPFQRMVARARLFGHIDEPARQGAPSHVAPVPLLPTGGTASSVIPIVPVLRLAFIDVRTGRPMPYLPLTVELDGSDYLASHPYRKPPLVGRRRAGERILADYHGVVSLRLRAEVARSGFALKIEVPDPFRAAMEASRAARARGGFAGAFCRHGERLPRNLRPVCTGNGADAHLIAGDPSSEAGRVLFERSVTVNMPAPPRPGDWNSIDDQTSPLSVHAEGENAAEIVVFVGRVTR